jgi:ribonuclease P protein subunit RPR2
MKRRYKKKPFKQRKEALKQIKAYFKLAKELFNKDKKLADDYVRKARKIGMKNKVRIPSNLQKQFCKHCYCYLKPSVNCRIRLAKKRIIYYCLICKKFMRFPYKR